jgi:hypothetical protein
MQLVVCYIYSKMQKTFSNWFFIYFFFKLRSSMLIQRLHFLIWRAGIYENVHDIRFSGCFISHFFFCWCAVYFIWKMNYYYTHMHIRCMQYPLDRRITHGKKTYKKIVYKVGIGERVLPNTQRVGITHVWYIFELNNLANMFTFFFVPTTIYAVYEMFAGMFQEDGHVQHNSNLKSFIDRVGFTCKI